MRETIDLCRGRGFVYTPFGRRIYIPFINDKIASRRNFAESAKLMLQFKVEYKPI